MVLQSSPPNHYIQTESGTLASMAAMMGFGNVYENSETSMAQLDLETALSYHPDLVLCVGASTQAEEHQKLMEEEFCKEFGILEQHFGDCKWRYSVFPVQLYCQHRNWNAGQYERIY